ncbi:MAG TPA: hypothetical protein VF017_18415 [Thermoanaerobaculia bacterium]|nr:hypothetical protein [Thermoanaerobaculia bacterium]
MSERPLSFEEARREAVFRTYLLRSALAARWSWNGTFTRVSTQLSTVFLLSRLVIHLDLALLLGGALPGRRPLLWLGLAFELPLLLAAARWILAGMHIDHRRRRTSGASGEDDRPPTWVELIALAIPLIGWLALLLWKPASPKGRPDPALAAGVTEHSVSQWAAMRSSPLLLILPWLGNSLLCGGMVLLLATPRRLDGEGLELAAGLTLLMHAVGAVLSLRIRDALRAEGASERQMLWVWGATLPWLLPAPGHLLGSLVLAWVARPTLPRKTLVAEAGAEGSRLHELGRHLNQNARRGGWWQQARRSMELDPPYHTSRTQRRFLWVCRARALLTLVDGAAMGVVSAAPRSFDLTLLGLLPSGQMVDLVRSGFGLAALAGAFLWGLSRAATLVRRRRGESAWENPESYFTLSSLAAYLGFSFGVAWVGDRDPGFPGILAASALPWLSGLLCWLALRRLLRSLRPMGAPESWPGRSRRLRLFSLTLLFPLGGALIGAWFRHGPAGWPEPIAPPMPSGSGT